MEQENFLLESVKSVEQIDGWSAQFTEWSSMVESVLWGEDVGHV